MRMCKYLAMSIVTVAVLAGSGAGQSTPIKPTPQPTPVPITNPKYDAELAKRLGGNDMGMRSFVLVILKTGPKTMPEGKERDAMFAGHMANINRLAAEGKLVMAGPLDKVDGWRGLYIFDVSEIDEAKKLTETDPVVVNGEMVAEYHKLYSSAGLKMMNEIYEKITKTKP